MLIAKTQNLKIKDLIHKKMFTRVHLKQTNYLFKFNIFIIVILSLIITPLNAKGVIVNGG